jgi:hypothetical protein
MLQQMSLFGDLTQRTNQYGHPLEDRPIARETDPNPSHVAAAQVRCGLSQMQATFVGILRASTNPMTAAEVAAAAFPDLDEPHAMCKRETLRKRASELVKRGWIRIVGERACAVNGNVASVYEVVQ